MPSGVYERTPEIREKARQAHLGKGIGRKPFLGHKHSPETREKMRQAHLGRQFSPDHRENLRKAGLGRKHSPETKEKLRQVHLGLHRSLETRSPYCPAHPYADKTGRVPRSHLVWEFAHHQLLPRCFVIHHINGIHEDDRVENLAPMFKREHKCWHRQAPLGRRRPVRV